MTPLRSFFECRKDIPRGNRQGGTSAMQPGRRQRRDAAVVLARAWLAADHSYSDASLELFCLRARRYQNDNLARDAQLAMSSTQLVMSSRCHLFVSGLT
jgi:hypothetical protein